MFNIIIAGITTAFSGIFSSGVEKLARLGSRLLFLTLFLGLVASVIDFFLQKITAYSFNGLDSCTAYFMNLIGFFPALGVFLQILSVGLLAKYAIRYFQDSL